GDTVWFDSNASAAQENGEPGIKNVQLTLTGSPSDTSLAAITATATTDGSGKYLFQHLPPGGYTVSVTGPPADLQATTATSADVPLATGQSYLDADFGYTGTGTIGDFVWFDTNADGHQDGGEPGLSGVKLTLTGTATDPSIGAISVPAENT